MSRSKDLFQLQKFDSILDGAKSRILEIDLLLNDNAKLELAQKAFDGKELVFEDKQKEFRRTEDAVEDHSVKIDQNQKRLYGGAITNPKELEDLQLEAESLQKYLLVLEERQLEAMLEMEDAENQMISSRKELEAARVEQNSLHKDLANEKLKLEENIKTTTSEKDAFLANNQVPDLPTYHSLRKSSGGIAVTIMASDSCSSCGANIPSAIAQEARSPGNLAFCPTCKRILHPE
jgi:predicted  nucleic acid-binding Zn-ribbon protein